MKLVQDENSLISDAQNLTAKHENPQPMELRFILALVCAMENSDSPNEVCDKWRNTVVGNYKLKNDYYAAVWYVWGRMINTKTPINHKNTLSIIADPKFKVRIDRFNLGDSTESTITKENLVESFKRIYEGYTNEDCDVEEVWDGLKGIIEANNIADRFDNALKLYRVNENLGAFLSEIDQIMRVKNGKKPTPTLYNMKSLGKLLGDAIREKRKAGNQYVPICLPELNPHALGGWARQEVSIIVAPSGSGKSVLAMRQAVERMRDGGHVIYVSLELSPYQTFVNLAVMATDLTKEEISAMVSDEEIAWLEGYVDLFMDKMEGTLQFFCSPEMELNQLVHYLGAIIGVSRSKNERVDLVIVDLLNNISVDKQYRLERDKYKDFMLALKEVAQTYDLAILGTAQMSNESGKQEKVTLEFIGESSYIGKYASLVLHICKPPVEYPVEGDIGIAEIKLLKVRENGIATGRTFVYLFNSIKLTFEYTKKYRNMEAVVRFLEREEKKRAKEELKEEEQGETPNAKSRSRRKSPEQPDRTEPKPAVGEED